MKRFAGTVILVFGLVVCSPVIAAGFILALLVTAFRIGWGLVEVIGEWLH